MQKTWRHTANWLACHALFSYTAWDHAPSSGWQWFGPSLINYEPRQGLAGSPTVQSDRGVSSVAIPSSDDSGSCQVDKTLLKTYSFASGLSSIPLPDYFFNAILLLS